MISKVQEAILDEPGIDAAESLELREVLQKLATGGATEDEQITVWKRIKLVAPKAWDVTQGIVVNVASAAIKKELGLS